MGCGASSPEIAAQAVVSKDIDKTLKQDDQKEKSRIKLLLLGSGSSGKSTFAKQMKLLYMEGFSDKEAAVFADVICLNILKNMKSLVLGADKFGYAIDPSNASAAEELRNSTIQLSDVELTKDRSVAISNLWKDPALRQTLDRVSEIQFDDSAVYFFNNLERISAENFRPTNEDILNLRARTIGIVETSFVYKKMNILMVDVGGQKNERKKWIHSFQDVTAILFVLGCSDYDLLLEEDMMTNRMVDAIRLFNDVVNNKWFARTNVVIFLNKKDLFAEKIKRIPLTIGFPEFKGKQNYEEGMAHIQKEIRAIDKSPKGSRQLFVHETCATDTQAVKIVFEAITSTLLGEALSMGGFE